MIGPETERIARDLYDALVSTLKEASPALVMSLILNLKQSKTFESLSPELKELLAKLVVRFGR